MSSISKRSRDNVEKALSLLQVTFGWQEDDLFIVDAESLTGRSQMTVRIIVREHSLQLSTPCYPELSQEQLSVVIWEEWRRRGEAAFCLLPEKEGEMLLTAVRLPRLDPKDEKAKVLSQQIDAAIRALDQSREKVGILLDDVEFYEQEVAGDQDAPS